MGNTAQAQQNTQEAIQFYQRAASLSPQPTTQLQAQLNQLNLLTQSPTTPEIQQQILTLVNTLPAKLETLPPAAVVCLRGLTLLKPC